MAANPEDYNADELEAPEWLDEAFFTKMLQQSEKAVNLKVTNFQISPAAMKGDHYASIMFRASVSYQASDAAAEQTISLIIKTMPEVEGSKKDMLKESFIFKTEIEAYTKVIPEFERTLRAVGDDVQFAPRCLYHSLSPKQIIIFEDLVPLGYTLIRERYLNLTEVKAAFLKIAKWHAMSYKLLQQNDKEFANFKYGLMTVDEWLNTDYIQSGRENFLHALDAVPTLTQYKRYFKSTQKDLIAKCVASFVEYQSDKQPNAIYALCHGDFHYKNMMFKLNAANDSLENLLLLDYQLCYAGPLVNDLIYAFYMLLSAEQRVKNFNELLYYYYTSFVTTLKQLNFEGKVPKFAELKQELWRHRHFEIYLLSTFLPMWYGIREADFDVDKAIESSEYCKNGLYKQKKFLDELETLLPYYLHLGYFESENN